MYNFGNIRFSVKISMIIMYERSKNSKGPNRKLVNLKMG